jgi:hypothetical protein
VVLGVLTLVAAGVVHRVQDLEQPAELVFLSLLLALPKFMVLEVAVMQAQGVAEEQTQETGPVEQALQAMGVVSMLPTILVVAVAGPPVATALPALAALAL